jgi:hypothetical protein
LCWTIRQFSRQSEPGGDGNANKGLFAHSRRFGKAFSLGSQTVNRILVNPRWGDLLENALSVPVFGGFKPLPGVMGNLLNSHHKDLIPNLTTVLVEAFSNLLLIY